MVVDAPPEDAYGGASKKRGVWDFVEVKSGLRYLVKDMKETWAYFIEHHDLAKWMGADKKHKRNHFPRRTTVDVQDFSENGTFKVAREHQSRYFQRRQYTLFGSILRRHVEDVNMPEEEEQKLLELFDEHQLPHVITETHIIITADPVFLYL